MSRTDDALAYERRPAVKKAMTLVRSLHKARTFGGGGSWAGFKMRLWDALNPGIPYPGQQWDVPQEYIYAEKRVLARWSLADAYWQVVGQWKGKSGPWRIVNHPILEQTKHDKLRERRHSLLRLEEAVETFRQEADRMRRGGERYLTNTPMMATPDSIAHFKAYVVEGSCDVALADQVLKPIRAEIAKLEKIDKKGAKAHAKT